ncbi:MAG: ferredoxin-thioredoxin reductase catalytic domain-containing protein [Patescibacteria group bacterium]
MTTEELKKEYEKYCVEQGYKLNPNPKVVDAIVKGLLKREQEFGERYCPCRRVTGDKEEDKKLICPCFWHKEEIAKDGHCHCGIFVK